MANIKRQLALLLTLTFTIHAFAAEAYIAETGVITANPNVIQADHIISLTKITLSDKAKQDSAHYFSHLGGTDSSLSSAGNLPPQVSLGMNNVPALDQGEYGTCATFAVTAALDAVYGKGDYISQLCQLEFSTYLNKQDSKNKKGWHGTSAGAVLKQIEKYGIISKAYQNQYGCAGVFQYPTTSDFDDNTVLSEDEFDKHSELIMAQISWRSLLTSDDSFTTDKNLVLNSVRQAIANGHRVVIGVLLDSAQMFNGARGSYKAVHDGWLLTPGLVKDAMAGSVDAGHALIITGYDDYGIIAGLGPFKNRGVFTIRNSWGPNWGDHGDAYMSYDYFKAFAYTAKEIIPT